MREHFQILPDRYDIVCILVGMAFLSEDTIREAVTAAFARPQRVKTILLRDWQLTVIVSCDHAFGPVTLAELAKLAEKMFVPFDQVSIWDVGPNTLEIFLDCDSPTPVERPQPLLNKKREV